MPVKYFTCIFANGWCAVLQRRVGTKRILSHFQRSDSRVWVTWSPFRPAVQESAVSDFLNLQKAVMDRVILDPSHVVILRAYRAWGWGNVVSLRMDRACL